jgi:hypothetical protein
MTTSDAWQEFSFRCDVGGCVLVEEIAGAIVIRDSKNPALPGLVFSRSEYADFCRRVRSNASRPARRFVGALITAAAQYVLTGPGRRPRACPRKPS